MRVNWPLVTFSGVQNLTALTVGINEKISLAPATPQMKPKQNDDLLSSSSFGEISRSRTFSAKLHHSRSCLPSSIASTNGANSKIDKKLRGKISLICKPIVSFIIRPFVRSNSRCFYIIREPTARRAIAQNRTLPTFAGQKVAERRVPFCTDILPVVLLDHRYRGPALLGDPLEVDPCTERG